MRNTTITEKPKRGLRTSSTFRALNHRNYRIWFIGQTISLIGTWMQTMAQQVLVYSLTGSAAALGLINFVALIPLVPLSLWGGSLVDRVSKRRVIVTTQSIMLIQALVLAGLTISGRVQIWHVFVLAFILGSATAVDLPARQAFTVEMVEGKDDLMNAIALNSAMFNMARAVGPAMAGVIVAATGEGIAFLLNAFTFLAVIVSLALMRNLPRPEYHAAVASDVRMHMGQGIRFVRGQQNILVIISVVAVSAFLSMPYSTLMPVFAEEILFKSAQPVVGLICGLNNARCVSPEALPLGLLMAAVGIGAVAGALYIASLHTNARRGLMLTIGTIGFPAVLLLFSTSRSFLLSLGLLLVMGFVFTWQNALANTLLQVASPDEMRGRVMSYYTMTTQVAMRLGGLQAGFMADWMGAAFSLGIGAVISLVYGLIIATRFPGIRKL
ncbi:MAG TPA: MFS transporter [Anaerolineaceae bacterium]